MLLNFFSNSFDDSLIVYRGAPNVRAIFPEKKNINTFDFQNVKSLAEYLLSDSLKSRLMCPGFGF
jgi:hypothetical protein